jgi:hypothetical protein
LSTRQIARFTKPKTPMVLAGEWDAIWSWHNDQEHECARKQEYGDAQWHKERQEQLRPHTTFGKKDVQVKEAT